MAGLELVHGGSGLEVEVVVLAVLGDGQHLHDVLREIEVVRIGVEARGEEPDELVAAGNLTADEQAFEVGTYLLVLLHFLGALGLCLIEVGDVALIAVDDVLGAELAGFVKLDGALEVEQEERGLGVRLVVLDYFVEGLVQALGIVLYVVCEILTHVVERGHRILGIRGGAVPVQLQQGVDEGVAVRLVAGVLGDDPAEEGGAVQKHVLARRGRAQVIGLAPVGQGVVVRFLLVVLLIVRQVLDAFSAVLSILSLCREVGREGNQKG